MIEQSLLVELNRMNTLVCFFFVQS